MRLLFHRSVCICNRLILFKGRVAVNNTPPYALAWPSNYVFAGGSDNVISIFDKDGKLHKQFDFSDTSCNEKEFSVACSSPSGQAVVVGSFNRY